MAELTEGCVKPAKGPIGLSTDKAIPGTGMEQSQEVAKMLARVGKEAPDFEANAFVEGEGFRPITLSDYKGQWIVLCFYPGDFTFV
jgi:peroxiredoxin (alkyl hydroperoxide reductase subunit C)